MPAEVKRVEKSRGIKEEEGMILCPTPSKNLRYFFLTPADFIKNEYTMEDMLPAMIIWIYDMNLLDTVTKFLPISKKDQQDQYFFGLVIDQHQVEGCLWGISDSKLEILNAASTSYKLQEEIIDAANIVLDDALLDFQPEPEKVLFGVPDDWLVKDDLKPEYLKLLSRLVKELGIKPLAYVSMTQAICHFVNKLTGVPLTAVLVKIALTLEVSVIKAGKVIATRSTERTQNLGGDVEGALASFSDIEVMPSKILIYGRGNMEKFKEELLSFSWMSKLPFLHLPKVEELDKDIHIKGLCLAGASEVEQNVLYYDKEIPRKILESTLTSSLPQPQPKPDEESFSSERALGMVGTDVLRVKTAEFFKFKKFIPKISINIPPFFKKIILLPILLLILALGILVFLHKAQVTVFIDLRVLERESQVAADPNANQVDEQSKIIPGKIVEVAISGSGKGSATGKKQIGDPAKGAVLLYNKTFAQKSFPSGTVLLSGSQAFTLDTSASIASASAVEGGIAFGKTTVNITADFIGPEGNLPAGKELSVKGADASSYSAKTDTAFSGGVSKDITIVTSDDQKRLLAQVASDLRKKAKDELQGKLSAGMKILEEALSENIQKQVYSKNINDQAADFSLNLSINFRGTAYNENDLKLIVSKLVETNVPEGYELDLSQTETQANVAKIEKNGKLIFTAKFRAKLSPKLDKNMLKNSLRGQSVERAAARLKEVPNVIGSNIELKPQIPIKALQRLPLLGRNIEIEVEAK